MRRFWLPFALALVLFENSIEDSIALDLSVTARAEAGLDPATREFMNRLPSVWRPQIKEIVNDTMDRVDASVKTYLEAIDKLISAKMVELQCKIVATEKGVVEDIVRRFPWVNQAGPMEKLQAEIAASRARRKYESSPIYLKALYDDIMLSTSVVWCQNGMVPTGQADAGKIIGDFGGKWLVWNRAESIGCKSAVECLDLYRKAVEQVANTSDPRDVKSSGGLVAYKEPDISGPLKRWLFGEGDFEPIETALTQLYQIENSIGAAQALRESSAIKKLEAAKEATNLAKREIDSIHTTVLRETVFANIVGDKCNYQLKVSEDRLKNPRTHLNEAQKNLGEALEMTNLVQKDVNEQNSLVATQIKRTTEPALFCSG